MEEAMTKSHFCHKCRKIVNPIKKFEIVCPLCQCGFIEELEYIARDYNDNDNSYCNGKLHAICLDGQLVKFLYWNRRHSPKEDAFLDLVLPGYRHGHGPDSVCTAEHQESKQAEADSYSLLLEEMPEPGLDSTAGLGSIDQTSPPYSPPNVNSPMPTTIAREYEDCDFRLIEEDS